MHYLFHYSNFLNSKMSNTLHVTIDVLHIRRNSSSENLIRKRKKISVVTQNHSKNVRNRVKSTHFEFNAIQKSLIEVTKSQRNVVLKNHNLQYCKIVNYLTTHVEKNLQNFVVVVKCRVEIRNFIVITRESVKCRAEIRDFIVITRES